MGKYVPALFQSAACIDWGPSKGGNAKVDGVLFVDLDDGLVDENRPKLAGITPLFRVLRCRRASSGRHTARRLMPSWSKCSRNGYWAWSKGVFHKDRNTGEKIKSAWSKVTKGIRQSLNYLCSISGGQPLGNTHLSEAVLVIKLP